MRVARDYAKFKNLIVFGTKFVSHEMEVCEYRNSFSTVITLYPWYINDSKSPFQCLIL